MKKLIIGDVHLNEVCAEYYRRILFPFLEYVRLEKEFDEVILIGDVMHSPTINNTISKLFKELLNIFSEYKITILNGNHEKISKTETIYDILILPDNVSIYKEIVLNRLI